MTDDTLRAALDRVIDAARTVDGYLTNGAPTGFPSVLRNALADLDAALAASAPDQGPHTHFINATGPISNVEVSPAVPEEPTDDRR